jgi:hypothetical protein
MQTKMIPVNGTAIADIQVRDFPVAATDQPTFHRQYTFKLDTGMGNSQVNSINSSQRTNKHPKRVQHSNKRAWRIHKPPWIDQVPNETHDQRAAFHVYPAWCKGCEIHPRSDGILN